MLNKIRKQTEGFTIIEVLIVLAIAGLIMLIVFLAVPALQRNSRNTTRRSEAGRYASAANEFVANQNGTLPGAGDAAAVKAAVGTTQYLTGTPVIQAYTGTVPLAAYTVTDSVRIVTNGQCSGNKVIAGSTNRQMAVQFGLEPSTGACLNI